MRVFPIPGRGFDSNIYILLDEKTVLIDTGSGFYASAIIKKIKKEIPPEKISHIILTHEHFDHTGGIPAVQKVCNAEILMHEKGAPTLEDGLDWSSSLFGAEQKKIMINKKLNEGDTISLGAHVLEVLHTPGHSEGSICLYERESKSLFSGDTVFSNGIGRTDFRGGNIVELVQSIERLTNLEVDALYPGHGEWIPHDGDINVTLAAEYARQLMNQYKGLY
jgi:glyoxylase-like metal-dependent hydrolase (beta-lactamase superfamily II)